MIDRLLRRLKPARSGTRPTYATSTWLFLRALGAIYLIAFVSLWVQLQGLVGSGGMLPAARYLEALRRLAGPERYHLLPTLAWLDASDAFLHALAAIGSAAAALVVAGLVEVPCLLVAWACYLSLMLVSRDFLSFQWDALLVETG